MNTSTISKVGTVAFTVLILPACTSSPSVRDANDVSIRLYDEAEYQLIMHGGRQPRSGMNAGTGAVSLGAAAFADCASAAGEPVTAIFVGSFCAAVGAISGGFAGATVSAVESMDDPGEVPGTMGSGTPTIDVKQAWHTRLRQSLDDEARKRGKTVVSFPDGDTLHVVAGEFLWDVKSVDKIAMVTTVLVATGGDGKFSREQFTLYGPYLALDEWKAEGGKRVVSEVDAFAGRISNKVWEIVE